MATTGRAAAPDLARGGMLLLIALANTTVYLYGREQSTGGFHPLDGSTLDRIVQALLITTVDLRVYPMFAFLVGYGLWMVHRRQLAAGRSARQARGILQRRNLWLIVFGAAHALLLWGGDVLGAYGFTGLVIVGLFLRRRDRTLWIWSAVGTVLLLALAALTALGALGALAGESVPESAGLPESAGADIALTGPVAAALARIAHWPLQVVVLQGPLGMVVPVAMLLGILAARHRLLEQPARHRRLLALLATGGIGIGTLGALPHALAHLGVIGGLQEVLWGFAPWQMVTGLLAGIGYVAVFGLLGALVDGRPAGRVRSAIEATGKRSMTSYLLQSVLCAPLLAAWGLGLGEHLHSTTMALVAIGVWLVTVVVAVQLERRGRRGPAETLLRALAYRRPRRGAGGSEAGGGAASARAVDGTAPGRPAADR